ncbi:conserved protein, unknown function [Hepatocystis sp. ex Piliocolobus tephrosceles]|nr:conserved protein, unknown function [Hepatocystis sp. ex Piliocolobus tephrosceles]
MDEPIEERGLKEQSNVLLELQINNIANKLANILYITNVSMKNNFELGNELAYAKFINDMKSYCVNLIQSMNNLSNNFHNLTCLPVHTIPKNPYNIMQDVNAITNNISVDDNIEKIKENKESLLCFNSKYGNSKKYYDTIVKKIEHFNDYIFYALNTLEYIKVPSKFEETKIYGNILSERLKNKPKDYDQLELYMAHVNYTFF